MGIVAALRINPELGAIVSDEGLWNLRFRRKAYYDNIHKLLDDDIADELGIEVAYAGSGYPSLHHEVVTATRRKLRRLWSERGEDNNENPPFRTVEDVSRIALEMMHAAIRRRIDLRLKFFFGFETDDLVQGAFTDGDRKIEIQQEVIQDKARKIATGEEGGKLSQAWFKARATTFGFDSERGITGYFLDPEKFVMCYNYEGWDAFGAGKYAAGIVLARYLNRKILNVRRIGYDPPEGLMTLLEAAITAVETFQETGGNINITLIDAREKTSRKRYREIFDDRARLATEITKSRMFGFLEKKQAELLINRLIFNNEGPHKIEKELMKRIPEPRAFELALRGYKLDEIPNILVEEPVSANKK